MEAELHVLGVNTDTEDGKAEAAVVKGKIDEEIDTKFTGDVCVLKCSGPRMRLWTTLYSVLTACILSLLLGTTIAYASPALLELRELPDPDFRFNSTLLLDLFGVRT